MQSHWRENIESSRVSLSELPAKLPNFQRRKSWGLNLQRRGNLVTTQYEKKKEK